MTICPTNTPDSELDLSSLTSRSGTSWLFFRVASRDYAIALETVAEVVAARAPHLVPLTPLDIGGVLNLRGEPIPVVDGGMVLQGESRRSTRHALVFERNELRLGLLVDYVLRIDRDLEPMSLDDLEMPEVESLCTEWRQSPGGGPLGIVDSDALLTRASGLLAGGSLQKEEPCQSAY